MAIDIEKALGIHPEALKLRTERAKILASNLANESTPGYQARDIDFAASLNEAMEQRQTGATEAGATGNAVAADSGASNGALPLGASSPPLLYRVPNLPSEDGNTVELGVEQAAFSQNASDFQASMTFINSTLHDIAKAIQGQ